MRTRLPATSQTYRLLSRMLLYQILMMDRFGLESLRCAARRRRVRGGGRWPDRGPEQDRDVPPSAPPPRPHGVRRLDEPPRVGIQGAAVSLALDGDRDDSLVAARDGPILGRAPGQTVAHAE